MGPFTALQPPVMLNQKWMPNQLLLPQGLSDEQTGSVTFAHYFLNELVMFWRLRSQSN